MKTHKLQINTLNAITIGRTLIILTTLILLPLLLMLSVLLLLPLSENFLTENCNKLSENPGQPSTTTADVRDGIYQPQPQLQLQPHHQQQQQTNCTQATAEPKLIIRNESRKEWRVEAGKNCFSLNQTAKATAITNRAKRFIIYTNSGVVKLVLGTSYPIMLVDTMRSLSYFINIQLQYMPPTRPIYWWSLYNSTTFPLRRQLRYATFLPHDKSREFIYGAFKVIFERAGLPGTSCLLKTICEVARMPFHASGGLFHALLNAIFIPSLPNVSAEYMNARQAGRAGADCARTFKECPKHKNWLERISHSV